MLKIWSAVVFNCTDLAWRVIVTKNNLLVNYTFGTPSFAFKTVSQSLRDCDKGSHSHHTVLWNEQQEVPGPFELDLHAAALHTALTAVAVDADASGEATCGLLYLMQTEYSPSSYFLVFYSCLASCECFQWTVNCVHKNPSAHHQSPRPQLFYALDQVFVISYGF